MKKAAYFILVLIGFCLLVVSCEKDNITNSYIKNNPDRMGKIAGDAKRILASAEKGWAMMVKTDMNSDVYTPVVLKFDTTKNRVFIRTVYGETADTESYFRVTEGTGAPQLIFTTGSIISTLYRVGPQASDLTDHIFNVIGVTSDTVSVQSYRSGKVYQKEGGVIYKLFKRPDSWKWADDDLIFDWGSDVFRKDIENVSASATLQNAVASEKNLQFTTSFIPLSEWDISFMQIWYPFDVNDNIGTGGFKDPEYCLFVFPYVDGNYSAAPVVGHNAISFYPQYGYMNNLYYTEYFINTFGAHYLVCNKVERSGRNVKMEFEAYDKKGNAVVKVAYDNTL